MQTTRSILLGVTAVVLLAGCGSSASTSSSSALAAPPASASGAASASQGAAAGSTASLTCSLAPSTLVNSDLGMTDLGAPKQTANSEGAVCLYSGGTNIVSLSMFNDTTAAKVNTEQQTFAKTEQIKTLAGLGDQAFTASLSPGDGLPSSNTLVARQGSVEVMLVSSASVTAEQSLTQHIFTKVG